LVAISGDFTQRARTEQFAEACRFLETLRDRGHEVLGVPGNHDIPLYDVLRRFLSPLTRYRKFIDDSLCPMLDLPGVTVLGINTARSLTFKDGHISHEQIDYIRRSFDGTGPEKPRVLVMHHPLFALPVGDGPELGKAMDDSDRALDVIADLGVDLVLAGHNHRASADEAEKLAKGAGKTLVVQAGTATSTRLRGEPQSFNRIEIDGSGVIVTVEVWNGNNFVSGDAAKFERHRGEWATAAGAPIAKAEDALN
jgi:3',5'-cyclic AMP phosphodiesterase CpdA